MAPNTIFPDTILVFLLLFAQPDVWTVNKCKYFGSFPVINKFSEAHFQSVTVTHTHYGFTCGRSCIEDVNELAHARRTVISTGRVLMSLSRSSIPCLMPRLPLEKEANQAP